MAEKETKTLIVRNISNPMSYAYGKKLNGQEGNIFEKDEQFEIPARATRTFEGKKVEFDVLKDLYAQAGKKNIVVGDGVVSADTLSRKNQEIELLKKEVEEANKAREKAEKALESAKKPASGAGNG